MDLDDLIKNADPARESAPPAGTSAIAHWTFAQITQTPVRRRRAVARPRFVFAGAMALGLLVVVGDLLIGSSPPPVSPAAAALRHAAVVVSDQSTPVPGPGQYLYTETRSLYQVTIYAKGGGSRSLFPVASAQYSETEQSWVDADGQGRGVVTRTPLRFPSAADQAAWDATSAGRGYTAHFAGSYVEPALRLLVADVSGLSTDPTTLERQIAGGGDGTNVDHIARGRSAVFQRTARLLVGPDAGMTSALRSALYRVLADQSGATLLGATTDHDGRAGLGVSLSSRSGVSELIFDPMSAGTLEVQYAPPASSLSGTSGEATLRCLTVATCGSSTTLLAPLHTSAVEAPLWTDSVTTGIVNSPDATEPLGTPNT